MNIFHFDQFYFNKKNYEFKKKLKNRKNCIPTNKKVRVCVDGNVERVRKWKDGHGGG